MALVGRDWSWVAWLGLAGVVGLGAYAFHRGDAQPRVLASEVEVRAGEALSRAGYGWASLRIQGTVGELQGEAPSEDARSGAYDAARRALSPYMGVPGVFAELDNRVRVKPVSAVPVSVAAVVASAPIAVPAPVAVVADEPKPTAERKSAEMLAAEKLAAQKVAGKRELARQEARGGEPPKACVDALAAAARAAPIRFEDGSTELPEGSAPALRRLAQVVGRCEGWRIVIEGHGDAGASRGASRQLAQTRSVAVASGLLREGVPVQRLALQTADRRLRSPEAAARRLPGAAGRITYQLVPQGTVTR